MHKKRSMFSCFVLNICKWPENVFKDPKYAKSTLKMFRYLILYTLEQHFLARKASYKVFYQKHASSSKSQKKVIILKRLFKKRLWTGNTQIDDVIKYI